MSGGGGVSGGVGSEWRGLGVSGGGGSEWRGWE